MAPGLPSDASQEERIATLQSFGLTENQAKAYLSLLQLGRATASSLNKLSGVPRNKVYSVVEELNEKGLVEIVLEDPIQFEARPIGRYLDMLASDLETKQKDLRKSIARLSEEFQIRATLSEEDLQGGSFRIYKGRRATLQQQMRMNRDAKVSVKILATPYSAARALSADVLGQYDDRTLLRFEVYSPLTKKNLPSVTRLFEVLGQSLRVTTGNPNNVVVKIVDDRQVLFTHVIPDSESTTQGDDIGVWTDNPVFLQLASDLIDRARERSQSFHSARMALELDQPFPEVRILQDPNEHRELLMLGLLQAKEIFAVSDTPMLLRGMATMGSPQLDEQFRQRGVKIRMITHVDDELLAQLEGKDFLEIRHMDRVPGNFIVLGDRVIRTHRMDPIADHPFEAGTVTYYSTLPQALVEARDHFERLWQAAKPMARGPKPEATTGDGTTEEEATV